MRKLSFLKSTMSVMVILTLSMLFINCSSSHDDDVPTNNKTFNPADFALTITKKEVTATVGLKIVYDLKNTSANSYNDYTQGSYSIKFTIKSTDGVIYQQVDHIPYIDAGVTYSGFTFLDYSPTKTLDLTTLTAVIIKDK
ncbi:hypothetical protein [Flavobacterium reichenbachii]|uniref:Uncharacterized protein n=1 Tax=Flavobacterium reichenbachii TaxID=362418 RepID=A0A085ZNM2_9FLAO|nr:hypothetical protein [Flavobacterium reichenbachii]KFF06036.1 hypothetical protein IW19_11100 [Flavobacterium reichenbachii]OXB14738.1 hypothetical protein B0A68_11845 [Flavobacterium reichenbachii]